MGTEVGALPRYMNWLSVATLISMPVGTIAQQPKPADSAYTLHQSVQEVVLYCAVLDKHGNPVLGLKRGVFQVMEEGHAATITHFSNKDEPLSIALVLDDSGSMQAKRAEVKQAAITLLQASNSQDETSITNFADTAYLDQEFTGDMARLQAALAQSKSVSGGTALFDTVIAAAEHSARSAHHRRQVILVVTDGRDNASLADLQADIQRVQMADGPVLYTIGLLYDLPAAESRRAGRDLATMAQQTGGSPFFLVPRARSAASPQKLRRTFATSTQLPFGHRKSSRKAVFERLR